MTSIYEHGSLETRRAVAAAEERAETDAAIRSMVAGTPYLRGIGEDCVRDGLSLEQARQRVQAYRVDLGTRAILTGEAPSAGDPSEGLTEESVLRALRALGGGE